MVLKGAGLFKGGQGVIMTVEESVAQPIIADTEMVLWRKTQGDGEKEEDFFAFAFLSTGIRWKIQSFTIGTLTIDANFIATGIDWWLKRTAGDAGTITTEIYLADGADEPTGAVLATGTRESSEVSAAGDGGIIEFPFVSPVTLSASTKYVALIKAPGAGAGNTLTIGRAETDGYAGGTGKHTLDSGANWIADNFDYTFAIKGTGDYILLNLGGTLRQVKLVDL